MRLDKRLMDLGLASSREKAKELIQAGFVLADGKALTKAGAEVSEESVVTLSGEAKPCPYVSRGGLKLEGAIRAFGLDVEGLCCLDAGASTGGFTDCLLQHGADFVCAVDVGHGQFSEKLADNPRISVNEGKNVRYLYREDFDREIDLVVSDLSYISLEKVLAPLAAVVKDEGELVCLVKPQFEAGPHKTDKHGVVRDPAVHLDVLEQVTLYARSIGLRTRGLCTSPIKGPEGNVEYLIYLSKKDIQEIDCTRVMLKQLVSNPELVLQAK